MLLRSKAWAHFEQGEYDTAEELADRACAIEIDRCRKPIGKQDQYIAAYGGVTSFTFNPDDTVVIRIALPTAG